MAIQYVYITEQHPEHGTRVLAFRCNAAQAKWYERVVVGLVEAGASPTQAQKTADDLVLALLVGKKPKSSVHECVIDGRRLFPVMTAEKMRELPTVGCPPEPIEAFIMQVEVPGRGIATVRYDFDDGQQRMFQYAVDDLVSHDVPKDHAWFTVVQVVGKLLNGARLTQGADEITRCLALHFLPMDAEDVIRLPSASEEDVVRWSFTPRADALGDDPEPQEPPGGNQDG